LFDELTIFAALSIYHWSQNYCCLL